MSSSDDDDDDDRRGRRGRQYKDSSEEEEEEDGDSNGGNDDDDENDNDGEFAPGSRKRKRRSKEDELYGVFLEDFEGAEKKSRAGRGEKSRRAGSAGQVSFVKSNTAKQQCMVGIFLNALVLGLSLSLCFALLLLCFVLLAFLAC